MVLAMLPVIHHTYIPKDRSALIIQVIDLETNCTAGMSVPISLGVDLRAFAKNVNRLSGEVIQKLEDDFKQHQKSYDTRV
jgi:hypothetical protein